MRVKILRAPVAICLLFCLPAIPESLGDEVLFEESFDHGLSAKWQVIGLGQKDYRVHDGALEMRLTPWKAEGPRPMLKVNLPFGTADSVVASVEIGVERDTLRRGELAGLSLTDREGSVFTVRVTNIDGYTVFAPGQAEYIGDPGQEGDPFGNYTVKYWPARKDFGPLRILVRSDYADFQVGPSEDGKFRTFFHSALRQSKEGLGFGLFATGGSEHENRWVRFDNFRVNETLGVS